MHTFVRNTILCSGVALGLSSAMAADATIRARQNALEGLLVAVDQLQTYAGKDQAVTFPATTYYPKKDVTKGVGPLYDDSVFGFRAFAQVCNERSYLTNATTYLTPAERTQWDNALKAYWNNNRNPRWVGVMDTALRVDRATNPAGTPTALPAQRYESNPATKFGEPKRDQLPVWLISGNEDFTINPETDTAYPSGYYTPDTVLPDPSSDPSVVWLVGAGSAGNATVSADGLDGRVKAKKQPIVPPAATAPAGHYAYWVGDESLKANFAVQDPYRSAPQGSPDYTKRLLAPQRTAWERMAGFVGTFSDDPQDARLLKLHTPGQLPALSSTLASGAKAHFHDLTPHSKSLLTDTALGGLRKDLSYFLETGSGLMANASIADHHLYSSNDPRFRAWSGTNAGFPLTTTNLPSWQNVRDWYQNSSFAGVGSGVTPGPDISPTVTYVMFHAGWSYDAASKTIRWHWLPCIVLWNPYNVFLMPATYDLEVGLSPALWQGFVGKENPTLAELQQDADADWREVTVAAGSGVTAPDGWPLLDRTGSNYFNSSGSAKLVRIFKGTRSGIGGTRYFAQIETGNPDSIDMNSGPWPYDANLGDGTTDAFGRFWYRVEKAAPADTYLAFSSTTGGLSSRGPLGAKSASFRFNPHSSVATPSLPVTRPLKFGITTGFDAGEAKVFTVAQDQQWSSGGTVTLANTFDPVAPTSMWFDALKLVNGPTSADGLKMNFDQSAGTIANPSVALSLSGNTVFQTSAFGLITFNNMMTPIRGTEYAAYAGFSTLGSSDSDGDGVLNRDEATPKFVSTWRPIYSSDAFSANVNAQGTNLRSSSIWPYGASWIQPLTGNGGATQGALLDRLPVLSRFNVTARDLNLHPLVDALRDLYHVNNRRSDGTPEGFSRVWPVQSNEAITKWDVGQAQGAKGFALVTPFSSQSIDSIQFNGLTNIAVRGVRDHDVPVVSIGQLQQANLARYAWHPFAPVGSSFASAYTDREAIAGIRSRPIGGRSAAIGEVPNNAENQMIDLCYLLNENLWDRYFLSTIRSDRQIEVPFANSRLRWRSTDEAPDYEQRSFDLAAAHLELAGGFNVNSTSVEAWKSLLLAFRDLVQAPSGSGQPNPSGTVPMAREPRSLSGGIEFTSTTRNPTDMGVAPPKDYSRIFNGSRYLTDAMVQILAERIVDEVRLRGPFLSLSDFVNRRLVAPAGSHSPSSDWYEARTNGYVGSEGSYSPTTGYLSGDNHPDYINPTYDPFIGLQGLAGTLQRALQVSGINGGVNHPLPDANDRVFSVRIKNEGGADYVPSSSHYTSNTSLLYNTSPRHSQDPALRGHLDSEHIAGAPVGEAGQLFDGAAGFVTQGDLLAMIGSALTPRGDTFLVRTYGDAVDANGNVIAAVRLEALVQRTVEPVVAAGFSGTERFRPVTPAGRKMKVIGLRWLSPDEY